MLLEIDKENQDKRHLNTIPRNTFYERSCLKMYGLSSCTYFSSIFHLDRKK